MAQTNRAEAHVQAQALKVFRAARAKGYRDAERDAHNLMAAKGFDPFGLLSGFSIAADWIIEKLPLGGVSDSASFRRQMREIDKQTEREVNAAKPVWTDVVMTLNAALGELGAAYGKMDRVTENLQKLNDTLPNVGEWYAMNDMPIRDYINKQLIAPINQLVPSKKNGEKIIGNLINGTAALFAEFMKFAGWNSEEEIEEIIAAAGIKNKSATDGYEVAQMKGYGAGSMYEDSATFKALNRRERAYLGDATSKAMVLEFGEGLVNAIASYYAANVSLDFQTSPEGLCKITGKIDAPFATDEQDLKRFIRKYTDRNGMICSNVGVDKVRGEKQYQEVFEINVSCQPR